MKLAISNIAWQPEEETKMISLITSHGVEGIEIALTKYWVEPTLATEHEIAELKKRFDSVRLSIPTAQALLFGHPELVLFGTDEDRIKTFEYIFKICRVSSEMGIKSLIFGSPKNRLRGKISGDSALEIAADFFHQLAYEISPLDITICIEPNPVEYGCDFIRTTGEAIELVQKVNHQNFRLNLDTSAIFLNHEEPEFIIPQCIPYTNHFHVSEPYLNPIGTMNNNHRIIAKVLQDCNYSGWISIEMRSGLTKRNDAIILSAIEFTKSVYLNCH